MYCLHISLCVAVLLVECSGLDPSIKWTNEQPLLYLHENYMMICKKSYVSLRIFLTKSYRWLEGSQFSSKVKSPQLVAEPSCQHGGKCDDEPDPRL